MVSFVSKRRLAQHRLLWLLSLSALAVLAMFMTSASAQAPSPVRGTFYPSMTREAYRAIEVTKRHCWGRFAPIDLLLYPDRERSTATARGGGRLIVTRVNRHDSSINLKFTIQAPEGMDFCLGYAQGGDGTTYLLRSKRDLRGLKLIRHRRFWTGYWIDPRRVKEITIQGERGLGDTGASPFTTYFLAGFRLARG